MCGLVLALLALPYGAEQKHDKTQSRSLQGTREARNPLNCQAKPHALITFLPCTEGRGPAFGMAPDAFSCCRLLLEKGQSLLQPSSATPTWHFPLLYLIPACPCSPLGRVRQQEGCRYPTGAPGTETPRAHYPSCSVRQHVTGLESGAVPGTPVCQQLRKLPAQAVIQVKRIFCSGTQELSREESSLPTPGQALHN